MAGDDHRVNAVEVIVFRHGIALERDEAADMGLSDEERPLTDKGRRRTRAAAAGLRAVLDGDRVDSVVTSDLLRARQTAEILVDYVESPPAVESDALRPGAGAEALDAWLHGQGARDRLVLVGHEPDLSDWVSWGLTRKRERILAFKKAGSCLIEFPGHAEGGTGTLRWLLTAAQLRALG